MAEAIENHGIIGDLRTTALVDIRGRIDFCCWPRFDGSTVFASLLDDVRGGFFEIVPLIENVRNRQLYIHGTNILLTRTLSESGIAEVSDFMPMQDPDGGQRLIRRVKSVRNDITFRMTCSPRFDYGRADHKIESKDEGVIFTSCDSDLRLRLRSSVPLSVERTNAIAEFRLEAGKSATFILEDADIEESISQKPRYAVEAFKRTSDFWRSWSSASKYNGKWQEIVARSAMVLKLLSSSEYGSVIAAATFGLPESTSSVRNWDYRYTWMRDAAFTIYAFLRLGYINEANAFIRWIETRAARVGSEGTIHVMYAFDGADVPEESTLQHLSGYLDSVPVRIGNAARHQFQIDIYGEVMDAVYLSDKYGEQISWNAWQGITRAMNWVADHWRDADDGIWESRGGPQQYLHSRLMCWVALDRTLRLAKKRSLPAPLLHWAEQRDSIYSNIHTSFWNEAGGYFRRSLESDAMDASCLLMPLVRFISPTDKRWLSTLRCVEQQLMDDSLVYRYSNHHEFDGVQGEEGTFNMCSFWFIECVARSGDLAKAQFLFEKMLGYANHLGLYSEEIGPAGEHLGNFPQAFSHMALISAAFYLNRALSNRQNPSSSGLA